jgi:predicted ATPase/DNA-binding CsgD family transcriptional regulator
VYERRDVGIDDALVDHLRERRLLLVLDNCDTVLAACRELVSLIVSRCHGLRILCTSRQRLGVPGETVVLLPPLDVPDSAERVSLTALADAEAPRLLVDRARAVAPGFELTDENRQAAIDICRRLDGLPLAIELAAVRLASITVTDLLERLDDRFRLLAAERGQQPPRHRALQTTVEWSYELLSEEERILWRRLSIFAGSFGIEAAETVCAGDGLERERVLDLAGTLVDKSILTMARGGRRTRYQLLETIRLYGAGHLREAGEEAELQRRHAAWYVELAAGGERPWWTTAEQAETLDLLDVEWANVEAALDFCAGSASDAEAGLRMAADLWLYWAVRGWYRIGRRHLETFLALAPAPTATRAMALWGLGCLAQAMGDHEVALARFEEGQRIGAEAGGVREPAYCLLGVGQVRLSLGEMELALEALAASREAMSEVDDEPGEHLALYFLGVALAAASQLSDARSLALEALRVSERAADTLSIGNLNALLGIVEWRLDDPQAAEVRLKEAVRALNRIGHRSGLATSVEGLAWVAASSGRLERAALLLGCATSVLQEHGITLAAYWRAYHDGCETAAREGLGEARFRACWEEGFAFDRQREIAAALEEPVPPQAQRLAADAGEDAFELTGRELEVARLVAGGLSNPAIAAKLFVSRATVKTHVSHILRKLALDSRVQLASWVAAHDPDSAAPSQR